MDNLQQTEVVLPQGANPVSSETEQTQKSESVKVTELPKMPTLAAVEKEYILQVLSAVGGSKEKAALVLGVSTKTVYNKLAKYATESQG